MRHFALAYPDDPEATRVDDAYLFGPDLLAAPVTTQGAPDRRVYVPRGRWVDLWRSAAYDERSGGLEPTRPRLLAGGTHVTLPAPLAELPLLVRAGAVLPLLPRDVDTLADYGAGAAGLVRAADRRGRMELLAFPRGRRVSHVGETERVVSEERRRRWSLTFRSTRLLRYSLRASMRTLRRPFHACRVTVGGRPVSRKRWRYDRKTGVLRAPFSARHATLSVHACGRAER